MGTGKKILVIEDSRMVLAMIKAMLEDVGFEVITAEKGQDGIDRARVYLPDLAIIDTLLPDTDGFEVCRQIRTFADSQKIKIVMMTGSVDAVDAVKARKMGADDYVVKTMDMDIMLTAVKQLI
ncbi:MAG: response regulator [Candidatus Omnitrophica bacterium]|nr:response regulator [Candidatus Omnitrophota bacterium]